MLLLVLSSVVRVSSLWVRGCFCSFQRAADFVSSLRERSLGLREKKGRVSGVATAWAVLPKCIARLSLMGWEAVTVLLGPTTK